MAYVIFTIKSPAKNHINVPANPLSRIHPAENELYIYRSPSCVISRSLLEKAGKCSSRCMLVCLRVWAWAWPGSICTLEHLTMGLCANRTPSNFMVHHHFPYTHAKNTAVHSPSSDTPKNDYIMVIYHVQLMKAHHILFATRSHNWCFTMGLPTETP